MGIISPCIKENILLNLDYVQAHPNLFAQRQEKIIAELETLGDIYSFWIEHPELRTAIPYGTKSPETIKKQAMKGIAAIKNAWYFLIRHSPSVEGLTPSLLKGINALVNQQRARDGRFRQERQFSSGDVTLNADGYIPPKARNIPSLIDGVLRDFQSQYSIDPIEAAIGAHLAIAAIQPFDEGNKRTARIVQDWALDTKGIPPAKIHMGESHLYRSLLLDTLVPYRDKDLAGQRRFYDFVASKVNDALEDIIGPTGPGS